MEIDEWGNRGREGGEEERILKRGKGWMTGLEEGEMETVTVVSGYFTHCLALACKQSRSHDPHTRNMTAHP